MFKEIIEENIVDSKLIWREIRKYIQFDFSNLEAFLLATVQKTEVQTSQLLNSPPMKERTVWVISRRNAE